MLSIWILLFHQPETRIIIKLNTTNEEWTWEDPKWPCRPEPTELRKHWQWSSHPSQGQANKLFVPQSRTNTQIHDVCCCLHNTVHGRGSHLKHQLILADTPVIIIMKNFNRRSFHGHHGSKCHELAQHIHSHTYINTCSYNQNLELNFHFEGTWGRGSKPEYPEKTPDSLPANRYHIIIRIENPASWMRIEPSPSNIGDKLAWPSNPSARVGEAGWPPLSNSASTSTWHF